MKSVLFFFFVSTCSINAVAFEFSAYYCNYQKHEPSANWQLGPFGIGWYEYVTSLGWNESTVVQKHIDQFYAADLQSFEREIGICATINSTDPSSLSFVMFYVEGKNLDMDEGCIFTGESVKYSKATQKIISADDIFVSKYGVTTSLATHQFLKILALREDLVTDPIYKCEQHMKTLGEEFVSETQSKSLIRRKFTR